MWKSSWNKRILVTQLNKLKTFKGKAEECLRSWEMSTCQEVKENVTKIMSRLAIEYLTNLGKNKIVKKTKTGKSSVKVWPNKYWQNFMWRRHFILKPMKCTNTTWKPSHIIFARAWRLFRSSVCFSVDIILLNIHTCILHMSWHEQNTCRKSICVCEIPSVYTIHYITSQVSFDM